MIFAKLRSNAAKRHARCRIPFYQTMMPRMKADRKIAFAITLAAMLMAVIGISEARAQSADVVVVQTSIIAQAAPAGSGEHRGRPPREALDACASAAAQAACRFSDPNGDSVTGTCRAPAANVALACVPAHPPQNG